MSLSPRPDARFDALGIGVAVRDLALLLHSQPVPDEKVRVREFHEIGGGPVPTALVTMARLGGRVAFLGVVGKDAPGDLVRRGLEAEGVDTSGMVVREGLETPTAVILVEGGRRTILECYVENPPLAFEDLASRESWLGSCRSLLLDPRMPSAQIEAARRVRRSGGWVVLDCGHPRRGVDEILSLTDIAIFSHSYPRALHGRGYDPDSFLREIVKRLPADGPRIAGITLGHEGCALLDTGGELHRIAGHPVEAVDSTGAGDVFHGAFVHALLQGDSVLEAGRFANAAAAMKCTGMTGRSAIPREIEIRRLANG